MFNFNKLILSWRIFINNEAKKKVTLFANSNHTLSFRPFLVYQGLAVFVVAIVLISAVGNMFYLSNVNDLIIKNVSVKQNTTIVANGNPVEWTTLVKRNDIKSSQYLLKLPKNAKNIKISSITAKQANEILSAKPKEQLSLTQRQAIAVAIQKNSSKGVFAKISNIFFADLEEAVSSAMESIAEQIIPPAAGEPATIVTNNAIIVNLSAQAAETPETEKSGNLETGATSDVEQTPAEEENSKKDKETKEEKKETKEEKQGNAKAQNAEETQNIGVSSEVAQTSDVIPADDSVIPSLTGNPGSEDTGKILDSLLQGNDNKDDYVQVTYETPAPIITEKETGAGKQVTISATSENPDQQLTDVLAFTAIPEIYKVGQENKIKIKWTNENGQEMPFTAYDTNNNGKIDYIEWTVPHLSDQIFEIIFISKAWHLDSNYEIIEDIYDTVATQDQNYATVPQGDYIRVTFYKTLTSQNDITIYARPSLRGGEADAAIHVYPVYTDTDGNQIEGQMLGTVSDGQNPDFSNIDHDGKYRVLLVNLQTPTDVFDLKVTNASIDIDYIVDPTPATVTDNFTDITKIADSTSLTVDTTGGTVSLSASSSWTCGNTLVDSRDSKTYTTVTIGTQCWMAANLNVGTMITSCTNGYAGVCTTGGDTVQNQTGYSGTTCGSIQKYCYSDTEANCTANGGLYQWNQTMCGSTTAGVQGICPTGWHVPTDAEQYTLENYLKDTGQTCDANRSAVYDCATAGTKLKSGGSSGFVGLLSGYRGTGGSFGSLTSYAYFWSSVQSSTLAFDRGLHSSLTTVYRNAYDKANGFSVRCLKN
mgnify:CR=1 FL=1